MNTQMKAILAKKLANKKKLNGFTLIELMVVVAIVGILTAVGLPELTKAQERAAVSAARAELTNAGKECSLELISGATAADVDLSGFALDSDKATCGSSLVVTTDKSVVTLAWASGSTVPGAISVAAK